MEADKTNLFVRFQRTANRQSCPECGARMTLIDWRKENGTLFVWYSCSRDGCNGQWLEKMCSGQPNVLEKVF